MSAETTTRIRMELIQDGHMHGKKIRSHNKWHSCPQQDEEDYADRRKGR